MKPRSEPVSVEPTGYTRQVITIKADVYEQLRQAAFSDGGRRLKIGDVIEAALSVADPEKLKAKLALLREDIRPSREAIKRLIDGMTQEEINALLDGPKK